MFSRYKNFLINLIFPAVVFGSLTGILTSAVITLYKWCAARVIAFSEAGYHHMREHLWIALPVLVALVGVAFLFSRIYRRIPNLQGGGIPTSIGILRGSLPCRWLSNLVGLFFMSLTSFLIGVPLGNEGPSVQMGTAIGKGSVSPMAKKHRAWKRYSMTGGACAGFSIATGAPISGILFAIEEAHQRVSPMILIVSAVSVLFAGITSDILAPIFSVSTSLFPALELITLSVKDIWIPLVVGAAVGLFAVLFLHYYEWIAALVGKKLKNIPRAWKIFLVFALTVGLGIVSYSFISTGHELILSLFEEHTAIAMLLVILFVRSTLTLLANTNGITGGIFLPLLSLGAVLASALGQILVNAFGLSESYYTMILVLGITACISGMMKMPLTAIVFAVEALSCHGNILYILVVSMTAFIITEIFEVRSINEIVLEGREESQNAGKTACVIDTFVTVQNDSFAIGKQIRDIFWPRNLFVLSVQHGVNHGAEVDEHGGKEIREGDILHVRYSTYDEGQTRQELLAIVGEQEFARSVDHVV